MALDLNSTKAIYAGIAGHLVKEEGRIPRSKFNQLLKMYGYDTLTKQDLHKQIDDINSNHEQMQVYLDFVEGKLNLDDLNGTNIDTGQDITEQALPTMVTNALVDATQTRALLTEYRKAQRKGGAQAYLSQLIADSLKEAVQTITPLSYTRGHQGTSDTTMVLTLADWHIGATVDDVYGNNYNLEIAKKRLEEYTAEVVKQINEVKPKEVVIMHLGDFIEGIDMRAVNQAFDAEINATKQLAEALRLYVSFIQSVSVALMEMDTEATITVGAIGGNHDRFTSNKKDAIYNDNLAYNVVDTLLLLDDNGAFINNLKVIDNRHDVYSVDLPIQEHQIIFVHGDTLPNGNKPKLPTLMRDHILTDVYLGHYHSVQMIQENKDNMSVMVGSLQGGNTYSKQLHLPSSKASQMITLYTQSKPTVYIPVFFTV